MDINQKILTFVSTKRKGDRTMDLTFELYKKIKDGMKITLTEKDVAEGDDFLIFNNPEETQTITIHTNRVPFWLEFDKDEPIRLEDCPKSFYRTLLKNIK